MKAATPALVALEQLGINYVAHTFDPDLATTDEIGYGRAAAHALGVDEERVYKTLLVESENGPLVAIVAVNSQLSLKALAHVVDAKRCEMLQPSEAARITGFVVGGISPFGQKKQLPTVIDESAVLHETIFVSGGRRGLDVEVGVNDLLRALQATVGAIAAVSD
ncbi:MAG: Cys-tRNA(Pro) deacylase [Actinobacteria bacterium]|nr:MAG: Cys-tRNA(Pro) deacylase [Actinomycetota bacterium]